MTKSGSGMFQSKKDKKVIDEKKLDEFASRALDGGSAPEATGSKPGRPVKTTSRVLKSVNFEKELIDDAQPIADRFFGGNFSAMTARAIRYYIDVAREKGNVP